MFQGSIVALVTPMSSSGEIDYSALVSLVNWHCESGTDAIVVMGTTGESVTVSKEEYQAVIEQVVKTTARRIPVIAGTGSCSTATAIEQTKIAEAAGVDGTLVVTPYYNKPTQAGLVAHFQAVAKSSALPMVLYNVPGRTAIDLLPEAVAELSTIDNIVGIKEATGDLERLAEIKVRVDSGFKLLSGDDPTALDFIEQGGHGVISVTANVAPRQMAEMCALAVEQSHKKAKLINEKLMPLHENLFIEPNPIPAKWLLHKLGRIPSGIRLPLLPLSAASQPRLMEAANKALNTNF